jgi:hypothetical protein
MQLNTRLLPIKVAGSMCKPVVKLLPEWYKSIVRSKVLFCAYMCRFFGNYQILCRLSCTYVH